jgi:hypothetical protein
MQNDNSSEFVNGNAVKAERSMKVLNVWITRLDGASRLRMNGRESANWLLCRLSDLFVFKSSEPLCEEPNSSDCTFRVAHNSQISGPKFEKLLVGIAEVKLMLEPARAALAIE